MKQNLKFSLKLFLSLIFAAFATFMISISFAVIFATASKWIFYTFTQVFSLIVLIVLIWQPMYSIGFKDSNMVRTGHRTEDMYRGFKIGAVAQIPFFLFLTVSVIFNFRFAVYRMFNSAYFWFLTAIAGKSEYMQMGVLKICAFALLLLTVPALSGVVYILGYKGIDLFSKFVYKKKKGK